MADVFLDDAGGLGTVTHGYTYSAHPVAAAAAMASLDVIERDDIPGNARRQGEHFMARMRGLAKHRLVGDVRGVGLMAAVELVSDRATKAAFARGDDTPARIARAAYRRGAMIRVSGSNIILSPPLVITRDEVDVLVDALDAAIAEVAQ